MANFKSWISWSFLTGILLCVFNAGYIYTSFFLNIIPGIDSFGHVVVGKYYAEHIFPSLWGYIPNGFQGLPFPQFYAPLFHVFISTLYNLFEVDYVLLYKVVTAGMLFVGTPVAFGFVVLRPLKKNAAKIIAVVSFVVTFSLFWGSYSNFGGTLQSVAGIGLVPHFFSLLIFCAWIGLVEKSIRGDRAAFFVSTVLLALSLLSSAHVVPLTFIFFLSIYVLIFVSFLCKVDTGLCALRKAAFLTLQGILSMSMAMIWYLPMVVNLEYVSGKLLVLSSQGLLFLLIHWWPVILAAVIVVIGGVKRKVSFIGLVCSLSFILIFIFLVTNFFKLIGFGVIHPYRALGIVFVVVPFIMGLFVELLLSYKIKNVTKAVFLMFILGLFLFSTFDKRFNKSVANINYHLPVNNAHDILSYIEKSGGGNLVVEGTSEISRFLPFLYEVGKEDVTERNITFLYDVIIESSANANFFMPFLKALSYTPVSSPIEMFPIKGRKDYEYLIPLGDMFGVSGYVSVSEPMKKNLLKSKSLALEYVSGPYSFFRKVVPSCEVCVVSDPVAVVSDLKLKHQTKDLVGFVEFNEALLGHYKEGVTFVWVDEEDPFLSKKLSFFKNIFVTNYSDYVLDSLSNVSKEVRLYSFEEVAELFSQKQSSWVFTSLYKKNKEGVVSFIDDFFEGQVKLGGSINKVSGTIIRKDNEVEVFLNPMELSPVLVKQSYFPSWKNQNGNPTFAATPFNTLTFSTGDFKLFFEKPREVFLGRLIALIGFFVTLLVSMFFKK